MTTPRRAWPPRDAKGRFTKRPPDPLAGFLTTWRPFELRVRLVDPTPENVLEVPRVVTYRLEELS